MMATERFHQNATAVHLATDLLPSSPYSRWSVQLMQAGIATGTSARSSSGTLVRPALGRPARALPAGDKDAPRPVHDILVITSDPATRELLRRALEAQGYGVAVASDGSGAIARLREGQCRLLLLDLSTPRADGLRILRSLRTAPARRPPVAIVLSTVHERAQVLEALEAGADDYIAKPFDVHDLAMRVALWLRRAGPSASGGPAGLHVHSLGRFQVAYGGQARLHEGRRSRKAGTLFKYLLTHQERTVTTTEVLALLWPDTPADLAATDLRSLLYQLRRLLGVGADGDSSLVHTRTTLALHPGPGDWWDVAEFSAWLARAAEWRQAGQIARAIEAYAAGVALYGGDYLAEDGDAPWAVPLRARLREDWLKALCAMALLHAERGEHEKQEVLLRTVLRADPYREPSYRALMTLVAAQGRRPEALLLFRQLQDLLGREFGASPDPATQALAASIGQGAPLD